MDSFIPRRMLNRLAIGLVVLAGSTGSVWAQAAVATDPAAQAPVATPKSSANQIWDAAKTGRNDELLNLLLSAPATGAAGSAALAANAELLKKNLEKRETTRGEKLAEANTKLNDDFAKQEPESLSEALKHAVEVYLLTKSEQREAFIREARIVELVNKADAAARAAEGKGDWFLANELFYRLNALLEEQGTYRTDTRRLGLRLMMIRMYAPEIFWQLRNKERLKDKKSPLPPYNSLGEKWQEKVEPVDRGMVTRAVMQAVRQHIESEKIPLREAMLGGIEALRTMATTGDLKAPFPGLNDQPKVDAFIAFLDDWSGRLMVPGMTVGQSHLEEFLTGLQNAGNQSIGIAYGALLHEFGNGAMAKYDEFSAIIWPDEIARFERMTRGNFRGVGVQIQLDEESQMIKVVTPLEGTPAQRAGIRAGDLIKKIDGQSAVGISLNQAVDLITGPVDSGVTITMERKSGDDPDGKQITQDIDFKLARAIIPLASVKGWKRVGAKEDDWDYFIDPANRIGYVRLLQFTEDTTKDLRNAVNQMRAAQGGGAINGLILDLRYNPGGLLTEAVSVSNSFIDKGLIVSTRGPRVAGEEKQATPGNVLLKDIPMVVLINEGSASASEIVSGAIRHYADVGELRAVVIGQRSFGKGSVQNVWPIAQRAQMKLTTQYYYLPDGRRLHRTPGATVWGVDPHLKVDTLLETDSEALRLRQDADVLPIDQKGEVVVDSKTPRPDPNKLLTDGLDIQLQTALAVLQSQAIKGQALATQPREPQRTPN